MPITCFATPAEFSQRIREYRHAALTPEPIEAFTLPSGVRVEYLPKEKLANALPSPQAPLVTGNTQPTTGLDAKALLQQQNQPQQQNPQALVSPQNPQDPAQVAPPVPNLHGRPAQNYILNYSGLGPPGTVDGNHARGTQKQAPGYSLSQHGQPGWYKLGSALFLNTISKEAQRTPSCTPDEISREIQQGGQSPRYLAPYMDERVKTILFSASCTPASGGIWDISVQKRAASPLPRLKELKQRSDVRDYKGKQQIARQLFDERPDEFEVDDPTGRMWGITHRPTNFRFHIPNDVARQLQHAVNKNREAALLAQLAAGQEKQSSAKPRPKKDATTSRAASALVGSAFGATASPALAGLLYHLSKTKYGQKVLPAMSEPVYRNYAAHGGLLGAAHGALYDPLRLASDKVDDTADSAMDRARELAGHSIV